MINCQINVLANFGAMESPEGAKDESIGQRPMGEMPIRRKP